MTLLLAFVLLLGGGLHAPAAQADAAPASDAGAAPAPAPGE